MKPSSIAGMTYRVADVARTVAFYESLGFRVGKQESGYARCYVNWFWVDLVVAEGPIETPDAAGAVMAIKVDDVDAFYREALAAGLHVEGEPRAGTAGTREITMRDPDGYRLAFFEKR